jgi:dephospho-CoA kinase
MKTIVLTGGIGSGKSTVSAILLELGAAVIDSDRVGREVVEPGAPGWQPVLEAFGRDILDQSGIINRRKLAKIVFTDPAALKKLDSIIHPLVDRRLSPACKNTRLRGKRPLLRRWP